MSEELLEIDAVLVVLMAGVSDADLVVDGVIEMEGALEIEMEFDEDGERELEPLLVADG